MILAVNMFKALILTRFAQKLVKQVESKLLTNSPGKFEKILELLLNF
jgi:hypothetical protein